MGKGKSDAALATMFGDPSFPILSIGCTNALSARAECVQHFGEVFSHEASMNARVSCIIPFIHTRLAKLSFNHSIGRTHSWRFSSFKYYPPVQIWQSFFLREIGRAKQVPGRNMLIWRGSLIAVKPVPALCVRLVRLRNHIFSSAGLAHTSHKCLQLLLPQVCEMLFLMYYKEQKKKKWWENVIFTIRVLSRLTALLTWAASLGWTSAVTCCNIYGEYHTPVSRSNSRIKWMAFFCSIL